MAASRVDSPFYRVRWVLRVRGEVALGPHHGAMLHALLANANRPDDGSGQPVFPDGFLTDAPEQARLIVRDGEAYAFGGTIVAATRDAARDRLAGLDAGLRRLGRSAADRRDALGGNFSVLQTVDLVAGRPLGPGDAPEPVPAARLDAEVRRAFALERMTLHFTSPLRLERPAAARAAGHQFVDRDWFDPWLFLSRVQDRLAAIGVVPRDEVETTTGAPPEALVLANRLVWLDLAYGRRDARKTLGGVVGRVVLRVADPIARAALAWGQRARVGKNLSFGFGAYRIEELGPPLEGGGRAVGLLDLALRPTAIDRRSELDRLDGGVLGAAAGAVRAARYTADPPGSIDLPDPDGGPPRRLLVPSARDRALQRLVLDQIAPALDRFFEASSMAWRRGLGRQTAARRIAAAHRDGFRFAVRADFDRFFESIPLDDLEDRLDAYLADAPTVALLMAWARAGRPDAARGLPTGAPVSPLLGNLYLDQFDEQVAAAGGRLVRYADDFLVLTRSRDEADRLHATAARLAEALRLTLNADSTVLDLAEPFTWLGFRFERRDGWTEIAEMPPRPVGELAWTNASRPTPTDGDLSLPGEDHGDGRAPRLAILGPDLIGLESSGTSLVARVRGGGPPLELDPAEVGTVVLLGTVDLSAGVLRRIVDRELTIVLADAAGHPRAVLASEPEAETPDLLRAQVRVADDPRRALSVARQLIAAKLSHHAALAAACPGRGRDRDGDPDLPTLLLEAATRAAAASSVEALRGIEGAAASAWYGRLRHRIGPGFNFRRRVAPGADDPVNVLLNIAQTALYRLSILAARAAGLSPGLGLLHTPGSRYATLAADLQEPFRHLADRAVIVATHRLRPGQFQRDDAGPFPLRLSPEAARQFQAILWRGLAARVAAPGQDEPVNYHNQMARQARSLRRHLLDPESPFTPFRHPEAEQDRP